MRAPAPDPHVPMSAFLPLLALLPASAAALPPGTVERGAVYEVTQVLTGGRGGPGADPLRAGLALRFVGPDGRAATADFFADGSGTGPGGEPTLLFKARFAPDAVGRWSYEVVAPPGGPKVLGPPRFFNCVPSDRPGPPRMLPGSRHFTRTNPSGEPEPWFWLADTAWNGVLRGEPGDWEEYLDGRKSQGFTAIQFVSTQWRGGEETLDAKPVVVEDGRVVGVNAETLREMDARVAAIAARGLAPAPVLLWALGETDPGRAWAEEDAVLVARHLKARWGAYGCVWLLGGDGKYEDRGRWERIGAAVFPAGESDGSGLGRGPVTLHMAGRKFHAGALLDEPWLDFVGYQSGHGAADHDLRWLTRGEPAAWWRTHDKPVVNLEPNYEAHPAYGTGVPHDAHHVRRAAWWSLLVAPPAGVSYGHQAVWPWNPAAGPVEGHAGLTTAGPWRDGLRPEGAGDMTVLKDFFLSGPWPDPRPVPELVADRPDDPAAFAAAARTPDGAWTVILAPVGGAVTLDADAVAPATTWTRFDPRTGERSPLTPTADGRFELPAGHDWVIDGRTA